MASALNSFFPPELRRTLQATGFDGGAELQDGPGRRGSARRAFAGARAPRLGVRRAPRPEAAGGAVGRVYRPAGTVRGHRGNAEGVRVPLMFALPVFPSPS